jgi:hypothetical protein
MPPFKPDDADFKEAVVDGKKRRVLSRARFEAFNTSLLGLGDLTRAATIVDAVVGVFELEGLAAYCRAAESDIAIPFLINEFLFWLVEQIKQEMRRKEHEDSILLWSPLPIFIKFSGEGMIVIWEVAGESEVTRRNIIANTLVICRNYRDFLAGIRRRLPDTPGVLRCALACGTVYSLGNGNDFVGAPILNATRLNRLQGITFCFDIRGFSLRDADKKDWTRREIIVKRVAVAGYGENQFVGLLRTESRGFTWEEKRQFKSV